MTNFYKKRLNFNKNLNIVPLRCFIVPVNLVSKISYRYQKSRVRSLVKFLTDAKNLEFETWFSHVGKNAIKR